MELSKQLHLCFVNYILSTVFHLITENVIPPIYALLKKRENTYTRLLEALKNLEMNLKPATIMMNFERAAINAFSKMFPETTLRGCLFHLSQCLWRQVQNVGMAQRYANDAEYAHQVRMLTALAFVAVDDLITAFEQLIESDYYIRENENLESIVDYFEDTWIGLPSRRGRRRDPMYPHALWNCFSAVKKNLPRTNNAIEGWRCCFKQLVGSIVQVSTLRRQCG